MIALSTLKTNCALLLVMSVSTSTNCLWLRALMLVVSVSTVYRIACNCSHLHEHTAAKGTDSGVYLSSEFEVSE